MEVKEELSNSSRGKTEGHEIKSSTESKWAPHCHRGAYRRNRRNCRLDAVLMFWVLWLHCGHVVNILVSANYMPRILGGERCTLVAHDQTVLEKSLYIISNYL